MFNDVWGNKWQKNVADRYNSPSLLSLFFVISLAVFLSLFPITVPLSLSLFSSLSICLFVFPLFFCFGCKMTHKWFNERVLNLCLSLSLLPLTSLSTSSKQYHADFVTESLLCADVFELFDLSFIYLSIIDTHIVFDSCSSQCCTVVPFRPHHPRDRPWRGSGTGNRVARCNWWFPAQWMFKNHLANPSNLNKSLFMSAYFLSKYYHKSTEKPVELIF